MALPTNADVIVVHGYWLDELTGVGVKQANNLPATIMFDPVPLLGANTTKTPNLRDLTSNAHLKTRTRVATVDPVTGYYATLLVASNDPDLDAYAGRRVTLLGEDPFIIEVPYSAPTVTVDAAMAAKTGLTQGSSTKAIWLTNATVIGAPPPQPTSSYLTSTQTLATIATAIETHDVDGAAHADIRALIGTPYTDEQARDALASALVAGPNVTITPNDGTDTITISTTGGGGTALTVRSVSANTTAVAGEFLKVDAGGGARTITPPSSPVAGSTVIVMKTDSSSNAVTWSGTLNGDSGGAQFVTQWAAATFTWDGSQWLVSSTNLASGGGPSLTTLLLSWAYAQAFQLTSNPIPRDSNEAITTSGVRWPDGSTGTFTTTTASSSFPGAIDAFTVTYVPSSGATKTVTQPAVTRDAAGAVTVQPAVTVS